MAEDVEGRKSPEKAGGIVYRQLSPRRFPFFLAI